MLSDERVTAICFCPHTRNLVTMLVEPNKAIEVGDCGGCAVDGTAYYGLRNVKLQPLIGAYRGSMPGMPGFVVAVVTDCEGADMVRGRT